MAVIKTWGKKYSDAIMCYACSSLAELAGAGALLSVALDHSRTESLPAGGLYLVAVGIPLGLLANSLAKATKRRYQQLVEEIELHGFTEPLLIRCKQSEYTRNLVEVIADEKDLAQEYSDSFKEYKLSRSTPVSSSL